jgi:membrane fusion protein (multidrug efflux system)
MLPGPSREEDSVGRLVADLGSGRAVVYLALLALSACGSDAPPAPPPVPVVVAPVAQREVKVLKEFIGTTEGHIDAEIRAQVSGYLLSRDYREGTLVKTGDVLFRIDARPFRATLDQARGDLERARAQRAKAEQDVARFTPLARDGAVSQQELDNAIQAARAGRAAVESAQAMVDKAAVDLDFTRITSPIDGIAGVANAQVGDLVGPGASKPLTTVSQVDPIQVATPISEREYLRFAQQIRATLEEGPTTNQYPLRLVLADGSVHPHPGRVSVTGREVDPSTGTIMLKSEFPNPDFTVRPGQYARVRAAVETLPAAVVVPQRAVTELQGTQQVAVVGADDVVQLRVVEVGPQDGSDIVIVKGLAAGERVVVEGIQKVRNGVKVAPQSAVAAPTGPGSAPAAPAPAAPAPKG